MDAFWWYVAGVLTPLVLFAAWLVPALVFGWVASARSVKAHAWTEGHEDGCAVPHGCVAHENPYV